MAGIQSASWRNWRSAREESKRLTIRRAVSAAAPQTAWLAARAWAFGNTLTTSAPIRGMRMRAVIM